MHKIYAYLHKEHYAILDSMLVHHEREFNGIFDP
jgi:hypothetical protein